MNFVANANTEHVYFEKGRSVGRLLGNIEVLETLFYEGILSVEGFRERLEPLLQRLEQVISQDVDFWKDDDYFFISILAQRQSKQRKAAKRPTKHQNVIA